MEVRNNICTYFTGQPSDLPRGRIKEDDLFHHETPVLSCGPVGDGRRLRKMDTVETIAAAPF
jgi:hypothetical protein